MVGTFHYDDPKCACFFRDGDSWTDEVIDRLRKDFHIFYDRKRYIPILLDNFSKKSGGYIVFGFEDDGALYFKKKDAINFEHQFNSRVFNGLMKELNAVGEYMKARGYNV